MDKNKDNIIEFPKIKIKENHFTSMEEVNKKIEDYKTSFSEELAELLWNHVLGEMARSGCNFDDNIEIYYPSMILVLESIKSLYLHTNGVHHPLQDFAEDAFEVSENFMDDEEEDSEE